MLAKVESLANSGIDGYIVGIEVDLGGGLASFDIVGLPDLAVRESRDRVRAAIKNIHESFYGHRITVNLAPANIRKEGSSFDLPIAVGILAAMGTVRREKLKDVAIVGELALDGTIRPVNGMLVMALAAREFARKAIILPYENLHETLVVEGIELIAVKSLREVCDYLNGLWEPAPVEDYVYETSEVAAAIEDFDEVKGQEQAKRALEVAAAGGHNLLMVGPPGSGKTMLSRRITGILPSLCLEESIELTKIYSVAGLLHPGQSLIQQRPFRSPHHTTSGAGLIGGGRIAHPGEVSLAHNGVLFLDELPEFKREVLEMLRQPLEDGEVTIARVAGTLSFPASFMLIASMNPCPCGFLNDPYKQCTCTSSQVQRYQARLSGPLLDRFDLQIEVPRLQEFEYDSVVSGESSTIIRQRVERVRRLQQQRFANSGIYCNAEMGGRELREFCQIGANEKNLLRQAVRRFSLSARAYFKLLKLARTIADLSESPQITSVHLAEAIQYRGMYRNS